MEANEKFLFNEVTSEESAAVSGGSVGDIAIQYAIYVTPSNSTGSSSTGSSSTGSSSFVSLFQLPNLLSNGIVPK